jgi:hypothetical protein
MLGKRVRPRLSRYRANEGSKAMICLNSECLKEFDAKTHNQKYCCDECCRVATNKRIMEKYYEKKAIRSGAVRICKNKGCEKQLSRYNYESVCSACESAVVKNNKKKLLDMINDASKAK